MKSFHFAVILSLFLYSCTTYKVETFYIGNGGTQYFLPPIEFEGDSQTATVDFTYRYTPGTAGPITCNFSLFLPQPLNTVSGAIFIVNKDTIRVNNIEQLFQDFAKMEFRYTGTIDTKGFSKVFDGHLSLFIISDSNTHIKFSPSSDFEKAAIIVRKTVLPNLK